MFISTLPIKIVIIVDLDFCFPLNPSVLNNKHIEVEILNFVLSKTLAISHKIKRDFTSNVGMNI